jgi:3-(3-hydroxy-phenyl)propionate hydroxylase
MTSLNTPDVDAFQGRMVPGAPLTDAPVQRASRDTWLLRSLGPEFTLLVFGDAPSWAPSLSNVTVLRIGTDLLDPQGLLAQRLDATPGTAYLIRPDQHVSGRWRKPNEEAVRAALAQTTCTQI